MSLNPQPSRVPMVTLADGTPGYITREWARYLTVEIFAALGGGAPVDLAVTTALVNNIVSIQEMESARYRPQNTDDLRKRVEALEALLMER